MTKFETPILTVDIVVLALLKLNAGLRDLDYLTFSAQPRQLER